MKVTDDVKYVGVNDHKIDLFEGQYTVPLGMAYNSYVIMDEKIAVMDIVDVRFGDEWLSNLKAELGGRKPDYLVVQHVEPDHSANIGRFLQEYPGTVLVGNAKTFAMIEQFYGLSGAERLVVKNGGTLELGRHTLKFVFAPMVHWPEVMVTYDEADKILFSADAFGKFGANDIEDPEGWACEARRYYFGIVGKYGMQAKNLLKAAAGLDISIICPLHGPVLSENLGYYIDLYDKWSTYTPETKGVFVAYTSVYGHTKEAALYVAERLKEGGCPKVKVADLARYDWAEAVEDAFRYDQMILATTTYNMDIFPFMRQFIDHLAERNYQNRKVALIENGTWAPAAIKVMRELLSKCKNVVEAETAVSIKSAMTDDNKAMLDKMAEELLAAYK
jgi:flavorubredoxin